jgi:hypothetical protein
MPKVSPQSETGNYPSTFPVVKTLCEPAQAAPCAGTWPHKFNWGQVEQESPGQTAESPDIAGFSGGFGPYIERSEPCKPKFAVVVDWFQCMVSGNLVSCLEYIANLYASGAVDRPHLEDVYTVADDIRFVLRHSEGKLKRMGAWGSVWDVVAFDELIGTLQVGNPQPQLFEHTAILKLENHVLYQSGWTSRLQDFFDLVGLEVRTVSRLDIALDGLEDITAKVQQLASKDIFRQRGRATIAPHEVRNGRWEGLKVGRVSSDIHATVYNKSKELERSNKSYIKDFWFRNGIEDCSQVSRFELRFRWKCLKRCDDWAKNIDLSRLENPRYLVSLVRTNIRNWLDFEYVGKDTNATRLQENKELTELFDWDAIGGELIERHPRKAPVDDSYRNMQTIRSLMHARTVNGVSIDLEEIKRLAIEFGLEEWYERKSGYIEEKWAKERMRRRKILGDFRKTIAA